MCREYCEMNIKTHIKLDLISEWTIIWIEIMNKKKAEVWQELLGSEELWKINNPSDYYALQIK